MSLYSCEYKFDLSDEIEIKKENNKELYIIDLKYEPIEIIGKGLLLTYNNKFYILTCEHCIFANCNNLKYLKLDISNYSNVEVNIKFYLPEVDICLFEIMNQVNIDKDTYYYRLEYVLDNELSNIGCFFVNDNEKIIVDFAMRYGNPSIKSKIKKPRIAKPTIGKSRVKKPVVLRRLVDHVVLFRCLSKKLIR